MNASMLLAAQRLLTEWDSDDTVQWIPMDMSVQRSYVALIKLVSIRFRVSQI